jgi:diguanylate cyclase (GGDEF)-like protein
MDVPAKSFPFRTEVRPDPRPKRGSATDTRPGQPTRMPRLSREAVVLAGVWILGLIALGSVTLFQSRADDTRKAQVVIAQMRIESGNLLAIAFNPALAAKSAAPAQSPTVPEMRQAKLVFNNSLATLSSLGHNGTPVQIEALSREYFRFIDQTEILVAKGNSRQAAMNLGKSEMPGGVQARLTAAFDHADDRYGRNAVESRTAARIGAVVAILFLLASFTIVFHGSAKARRRSYLDSTIDALTGLGNRRKLFADVKVGDSAEGETRTVGIFDLDGFKSYNDTFGHPAGDALLARLGGRLAVTVGDRGDAYRIGGDEFVVITPSADAEALLAAAQAALSEKGEAFDVGCSQGAALITAGSSLDDALHVADQRLYTNKRIVHAELQSETRDALLQVLAEQDSGLISHLGHVALLAEATAIGLGLSTEEAQMARLAAQLHDVGKAAIPASILEKAGPLDEHERSLMELHTVIGERILAAAPTLLSLAPIVRATHERLDGTGYPDGLRLDQIPICSRIIAVVDAYDAMTNDRSYRPAMSTASALVELRKHSGTQFEPRIVEALALALQGRALRLVAA